MVTSARHRALARLLHDAPHSEPRFAPLHAQIVRYRERAAALFRRLVDLEAQGNDNLAPVRLALIRCSERVEDLAALIDEQRGRVGAAKGEGAGETARASRRVIDAPDARSAAFDFADAPTIPRR